MPRGRFGHAANDSIGVRACGAAQLFDCLGHRWDGMLPQQFQHAHVLPDSEAAAVPIFQPCSQFAKRRREFPIAVDVRVVQSGRASGKRRQIMQRIKNLITRFIAPFMCGHDLIGGTPVPRAKDLVELIVIQWDECLAFFGPMLLDEPADRIVTACIAVLVPQPFKDPHRRMPLLRRLRLVIGENLQNPIMKRSQPGR